MTTPKLLDLFCGAGGASMGYHRAGFDVTGVDIKPQPRYPFRFIQGDALEVDLSGYDVIHASPPCQAYVQLSAKHRGKGTVADGHEGLIPAVRARMWSPARVYVIENVMGAAPHLVDPIRLHGGMFGDLRVFRPRFFECSWAIEQPRAPRPTDHIPVYGKLDGRLLWRRKDGTELRAPRSLRVAQDAMGIDWMEWHELTEAIPPAYTEFIGRQLLAVLREAA